MNKQKPESKENVISFLLGYGSGSCSCSGSGSSSVALKCCTNNAAKLNESRERAGWVAWRSVRVEDVGDFGRAINMKVSCLARPPLLLLLSLPLLLLLCRAADSLSNILIQEIEMKLLGVKLIENILHFQRPLPAKVCADPSILSFPFRSVLFVLLSNCDSAKYSFVV